MDALLCHKSRLLILFISLLLTVTTAVGSLFSMTISVYNKCCRPSANVLDPYCEAVLFCWAINHHQADDTSSVSVYVENNRFAEIMIKAVKQGCRYKLLDTRKHRAKHL